MIYISIINRGLHPPLQSFSSGVLTKGLKLLAAHYTIQPFGLSDEGLRLRPFKKFQSIGINAFEILIAPFYTL